MTLNFLLILAMGSGMIVLNLGIQVWAVYRLIQFFRRAEAARSPRSTSRQDLKVLSITMGFLFVAHVLQFATWALLFWLLGEFDDFETVFYHSAVNFTSLGYGDIVMSEQARLLGALEAANGVLMFGLTAGLVLSVLHDLLSRHDELRGLAKSHREDGAD